MTLFVVIVALLRALITTSPPPRVGASIAVAASAAPTDDSTAVAAAVASFHRALAASDSAAVLALLSPDVRITESGDVETLNAYRAHHLPADIAYARAVPATRRIVHLIVAGDVAWVTSKSEAHGTFNGRSVNSIGAETMVLTRSAVDRSRWIIRAVHWSSHRAS